MSICCDEWDRTCLDLSSKLAEPFCSAFELYGYRLFAPLDPEKFDNCITRTEEIATRALLLIGAAAAVAVSVLAPTIVITSILSAGVASRIFRAIGFALQKNNFTYVKGNGAEKELDPEHPQIDIMTLNTLGIGGGLSRDHGGCVHWSKRFEPLLEKIRSANADVIVLQEIYDTAFAEALIERLSGEYAHFYTHLGANALGSVGGCMVISRCAVHDFSNTSFTNNDWSLNRGFATLEIKANARAEAPCMRIIGTHLIHGFSDDAKANRVAQIAEIIDSLARKEFALPTIVTGDFNIERDQPEGQFLRDYMIHGYTENRPTCTNRLTIQAYPSSDPEEETIDFISLIKENLPDGRRVQTIENGVRLENCRRIETSDATYNTKTALSDHTGLILTLRG